MAGKPTYIRGDWKAVCDICGREYRGSELRMRWDGFMACSGDWEPRQPQDFVRGVADLMKVPWSRPEGADRFILDSFLVGFTQLLCTSTSTLDIVVSPTTKRQLNEKPLNSNTLG